MAILVQAFYFHWQYEFYWESHMYYTTCNEEKKCGEQPLKSSNHHSFCKLSCDQNAKLVSPAFFETLHAHAMEASLNQWWTERHKNDECWKLQSKLCFFRCLRSSLRAHMVMETQIL